MHIRRFIINQMVISLLFAWWLVPFPQAADEASAPLTNIVQLRRLSAIEAGRDLPVNLQGIVTYSAPSRGLLFVQDPTGGIFVSPLTKVWNWPVGQKVAITGVASQGSHLPYVNQAVLQDLGMGALPEARLLTFTQLAAGTEDGNWVEVKGVVRTATLTEGRLFLELTAEGKRLQAVFSDASSDQVDPDALVDAEVRLQAVAGVVFTETNNPIFIVLHAPSLASLTVDVKAAEPPVQPINRLVMPTPAAALVHRVRVRGAINVDGDGICGITDQTGAAHVQSLERLAAQTNSLAEVLGFPSGSSEAPVFEDALIRFLSSSWPEIDAFQTNTRPELLSVLTQAKAIRRLSQTEAQRGYPVRIRGVVTYADSEWKMLFAQDDSSGIYVFEEPFAFSGAAGQLVEIEGFSGSGQFAPIIRQPRIQMLGQGVLPIARTVTWDQVMSGSQDAQRVSIPGIVRNVVMENGHLTLTISTTGGMLKAFIPGFKTNQIPAFLVDAEVQAVGVCGSRYNKDRQLTSAQLMVAGLKDVRVTKSAIADPFALPIQSISRLLRFQPQSELRHRIRVRGTVTYRDPRYYTLFIQDGQHSLYVRALRIPKIEVGDEVDVVGFISAEAYGPVMSEAVFRRIGPGQLPAPVALTVAQAASGDYDSDLITLEARLVDRVRGTEGKGLVLQEAEWTFLAYLEGTQSVGEIAAIRQGSLLRLTGICSLQYNENQVGTKLFLHLRSPSDIAVLKQPPWWSARHWLVLLGALLLVIGATIGWIVLLHRNVQKQTAIIRGKLEHEAALEAQLLHIQKMEAIGQLAGGVAHDFNNILAATMLNLNALKEHPDAHQEILDTVNEIEKDTHRAANLTRQLLLFSRRQTMEIKRLNLNKLLAGLMNMLKRLLGEHISVDIAESKEALWVNGDAGMIEQLVVNLCVNARDAMPKGGHLKIATEQVQIGPGEVSRQNDSRVGPYVRLSVADTGCGMDDTTLARIFEPFFTTKAPGKGTGLGLASVYGIAKQHQGWVEVESTVGIGSTFRVYFPMAEKIEEIESSKTIAPVSGGTETVLLVEDEASLRRLAKIALERYGYRVLESKNGVEALRLWEEHQGQIALLFTDMVMPEGITGLELANRLQHVKPDLKVVLTRGYSLDLVSHGIVDRAGLRFLPKPYTPATMAAFIRICLDEKPYQH